MIFTQVINLYGRSSLETPSGFYNLLARYCEHGCSVAAPLSEGVASRNRGGHGGPPVQGSRKG